MQTVEIALQTVPQTRTAATRAGAASRLAYVDAIRIVLMTLVIMVHAAATYGTMEVWTYTDPASKDELTGILMDLFLLLCQSFFMGWFFFYAGYLTPGSYDKKGIGKFWKDRLVRLGIPLLVYTLILSRVPNYIDEAANQGLRMTFWKYSLQTFWVDADSGPTWFLFALLVFVAGYTLWRLVTRLFAKGQLSWATRLPAPGIKALLGLALVMSAGMFAVSQGIPIAQDYRVFGAIPLQVAFFPFYILLFAGGTLAFRNGWMERLHSQDLRFWACLSAALVIGMPALLFLGGAPDGYFDLFLSGFNWRCILMSLWFGFACVTFGTTLTLWFRNRIKPSNRLAAFVGPNTFAMYLIHPLVLVPITYGLSFVAIHPLIKFVLASIATVIACLYIAVGIRRLPGVKNFL